MSNKKNITLNQVKKFLLDRGFIIKKKKENIIAKNAIKNLYFTSLSSLIIILSFFLIPKIIEVNKSQFFFSY